MLHFGYDQGPVVFSDELSVSSDSVAEARSTLDGVGQILVCRERLFSRGLDQIGVRSPRGVLFGTNVWV